MRWGEIKSKVINILPFKKKIKEAAEENLKSSIKRDYVVKLPGEIDLEQLRKQIYLSPWSTTGFKHTCKITESENGEKVLIVQYKAISKSKAILIENIVDDLISNLKKG